MFLVKIIFSHKIERDRESKGNKKDSYMVSASSNSISIVMDNAMKR